jgi:hypothetical protein
VTSNEIAKKITDSLSEIGLISLWADFETKNGSSSCVNAIIEANRMPTIVIAITNKVVYKLISSIL